MRLGSLALVDDFPPRDSLCYKSASVIILLLMSFDPETKTSCLIFSTSLFDSFVV